jgi:Domain of unknown function (DUF4159)
MWESRSDFQGRREGRKTCFWFSRLSTTPHWRCIRDDKGRIIVAICHNMDLGDAWEWSDDPKYSEKWASLAYRIAVNYFVYDLTH